jgi:[FeFe] hydrogenase H-cluster maturation GTPase HydF
MRCSNGAGGNDMAGIDRLILTLVGRRNAGKSSLINALTGQEIAIVSDTPGTTTDPVAKTYELLPIGPVTFYDTAGIDDVGELGEKRVKATRRALWRADIVLMVLDERGLGPLLTDLLDELASHETPVIAVCNKSDAGAPPEDDIRLLRSRGIPVFSVSSRTGEGVRELKDRMAQLVPADLTAEKVLVGDLIAPGSVVLLVTPIDLAAPAGRLILPQVQTIREILDHDAVAMIVKERELEEALNRLKDKPALVVADSQAILKVVGDVPRDVPLTTFSTVFARLKGDLSLLTDGADAIDKLKDGDRVLIAEACSHHVQADDIGRVKIPRWLRQYTGKELEVEVYAGHDFPDDLERFQLVIHCGACMSNRAEMMRRIRECKRCGVPITNYGVAISKLHGVLDRVIEPFGGR